VVVYSKCVLDNATTSSIDCHNTYEMLELC